MHMPFTPEISVGSGVPIFRQVIDQIRLAAVTGRLAEGEQLPSVRALAERLLVNPNTIAKAYSELARERVIDTRQGRGVFIAPLRQMYNKAERARRLTPLLDALVHEALSLGYDADEIESALRQRLAKMRIAEPSKTERASA
jgi:GntR family transcriptional regulator